MDDDREAPGPDEAGDVRFVRYQNRFYRVMTMAGGGLVLILGLSGAVLSRTLDPQPPIQWMWLDLGVTAVLFTWYSLGMRCGLDVADDSFVISAEPARGGGFGQMQEGEQRRIVPTFDFDVVEPAFARSEPVRLPAGRTTIGAQQLGAAATEHVGVPSFVFSVAEVEASEP